MRRTALHWACQGGHIRMVELLMEFGADTKVNLSPSTSCPTQSIVEHLPIA